MQPEHLKDNLYNIALQDRYDELIYYSKDIWSETAAGGFSKKKIEIDSSKPFNKSPDKHTSSKDVTKKDSSMGTSSIPGSVKKTVIKLNSMQSASSNAGGGREQLVNQM